jgi:hypothetical protein
MRTAATHNTSELEGLSDDELFSAVASRPATSQYTQHLYDLVAKAMVSSRTAHRRESLRAS